MQWRSTAVTWDNLTDKLSEARRTPETAAAYAAMTKDQKGRVKDVGGFVGGALADGRRNAASVRSRSLVTLDIDYATDDTVGTVRDALAGLSWCLYSTHSHTPGKPRFRLVVPLSRDVSPDEYIPIARKVAEDVGIDTFDDSTYEPHRLMYWPSVSKDGEFVYKDARGSELDPDQMLGRYRDWRDVSEWPVSSRVRTALRKRTTKQEDPTAKTGVIGAFCRAYGITEAMDTFLPGLYAKAPGKDRYTYTKGSTAGGAIIYEDKWLYSHHGTDPCCEREVNAFDMVRLHLFGDMDASSSPDTPVNRLPSFQAMNDLVQKDQKAAGQMALDRAAEIEADFGGIEPGKDDWRRGIKTGKNGYLPTLENFYYIFTHDPALLAGDVRRDLFNGKDIVCGSMPWKRDGRSRYWTETDNAELLVYLSQHYRYDGYKTQILDAWNAAVQLKAFHPVRDYLNGLPEWDGEPRLDSLLHDYLGSSDDELTRAMTRKHLVAAVARIMRPGTKYDYVLTLIGPEGVGKSTIIRALGGEWFSDSFSAANIGDKEAMAQLRSAWLFELAELKDYKRSDVEAFKAFVSKNEDTFRAAYARTTETHPRQCVFFATTNENDFLKGDTGNRRFWPVDIGVDKPTKNVFSLIRDRETVGQIWAEALKRYRDGEELYLPADLEKIARERQAGHSTISNDDRKGLIDAFLRRELPLGWWSMTRTQRRDFFVNNGEIAPDDHGNRLGFRRDTICVMEVQTECLGVRGDYDRYKARELSQVLGTIEGLEPMGLARTAYLRDGFWHGDKEYGPQRRFRITEAFWDRVTDPCNEERTEV